MVYRQSFVPVQGRKVQHLFIREIRRMKHARCFPKLAWCSPTAPRGVQLLLVLCGTFPKTMFVRSVLFQTSDPANIVLRNVPQRSSSSRTPPGRSWQTPSGLEEAAEGASIFVFPVQDSHFIEFPFSQYFACFQFGDRFPFYRIPILSRRDCTGTTSGLT